MRKISFIFLSTFILSAFFAQSALATFIDVPQTHENYQAIDYLERTGILQGYEDGTFRPDQQVNRAEAVKIVIAPLYNDLITPDTSPFSDVPTDLWYAPYVQKAKDEGVVSGSGQTGNFEGAQPVKKVEYLKILLLAHKLNTDEFANPTEQLFTDVTNLSDWYIPHLYFAASINVVTSDANNYIYPGRALTRAEVAEITYRLLSNLAGGETQLYLSRSESEIIKTLQYIDSGNIDAAELSAQKAVDYSNQALSLSPDEPIVKAANKISFAFQKLVNAYREGLNSNYQGVVDFAGEAWNLAQEGKDIHSSVTTLADYIQEQAHTMASDARILGGL